MYDISTYLHILHLEIPEWMTPYLHVPCLERLKDIGLFCGVDYSCLFSPHAFYSRYDHSVGVALITWHFTKDKKATLAALYHDISTPVFSHAIDFKNKDYLNQESTEMDNAKMILEDQQLLAHLAKDHIDPKSILYYSDYPVADLKTPSLCADRLEYMYSTGYFICDSFDLDLIQTTYENIIITESGELGFQDESIAKEFFDASIVVTQLFLEPFDKITLQILASLCDRALEIQLIQPSDLYTKKERDIVNLFASSKDPIIQQLYQILTKQHTVITQQQPLNHAFCMKIDVKRRYVNPLIFKNRLSSINNEVHQRIQALMITKDEYICVPYL